MSGMASQITSLRIVYSTVYPGAGQRKHQSPASLAFVRGIHRGPVNSPHKWPVTRKLFPFDDVIMQLPHPQWGNPEGQINHITHHDIKCISTQHRWLITFIIKCVTKLHIHSQTSTVQPLKFGNGWVIASRTLLGMWLLIYAVIWINPCELKSPLVSGADDITKTKQGKLGASFMGFTVIQM